MRREGRSEITMSGTLFVMDTPTRVSSSLKEDRLTVGLDWPHASASASSGGGCPEG